MRTGIDIDGVILDFVTPFLELVKKKYRTDLSHSNIYLHNMGLALGLRQENLVSLIDQTLNENSFGLIKGAREALGKLCNFDLTLVTSRSKDFEEMTKTSLIRNGILTLPLIHVSSPKWKNLNQRFDIFVEDDVSEAIELSSRIPSVILLDQPWNQSMNLDKAFVRAKNWEHVVFLINRLNN